MAVGFQARNTMQIQVNQTTLELPDEARISDALTAFGATPPYAVALNGRFVARGRHAEARLQAGDRLEVVQPVAGG